MKRYWPKSDFHKPLRAAVGVGVGAGVVVAGYESRDRTNNDNKKMLKLKMKTARRKTSAKDFRQDDIKGRQPGDSLVWTMLSGHFIFRLPGSLRGHSLPEGFKEKQ